MSRLKIGMISFDHVHADMRMKALLEQPEDVEIVAISEKDEARGRASQKKYGGELYHDYRKLLERKDLDFIASASHRTYTQFCAFGQRGERSIAQTEEGTLAAAGEADVTTEVRLRQLQSGFSYFVSFGLSYTFGSIFNNVVNPRFDR